MQRRFSKSLVLALVIGLRFLDNHGAFADVGHEDTGIRMYSSSGNEAVAPRFSIELERYIFPHTNWYGKYRILRVRIANPSKKVIRLSSANDEVRAIVGEKQVRAHLVPSATVPEIWDKLDQDVRDHLAYPKALAAESAIYVYLFFPADELSEVPDVFSWKVSSLEKTVKIETPPATAK